MFIFTQQMKTIRSKKREKKYFKKNFESKYNILSICIYFCIFNGKDKDKLFAHLFFASCALEIIKGHTSGNYKECIFNTKSISCQYFSDPQVTLFFMLISFFVFKSQYVLKLEFPNSSNTHDTFH